MSDLALKPIVLVDSWVSGNRTHTGIGYIVMDGVSKVVVVHFT